MRKFHPPHIYQDNKFYFITAGTFENRNFFDALAKKSIFVQTLRKALEKFSFELIAWVLLDHHYHMMIEVGLGKRLGAFISNLHVNSSRFLNKFENKNGRKIWYQYWDRCVRSEADFWTRINYIHYNPAKHGYVANLREYLFSSYNLYLETKGKDWMDSCFLNYPIIDFALEEGD
ncbi:transposase [bacterium]|nr:transposase [bacterium]